MPSSSQPFSPDEISLPVEATPVKQATGHSQWIRLVVMIGLIALMFALEFHIFRGENSAYSNDVILLAIGAVLAIAVVGGVIRQQPDMTRERSAVHPAAPPKTRIRWLWFAVSLGLACFMSWRSIQRPPQAFLGEYVLIWLLTVVALISAVSPTLKKSAEPDKKPILRWEYGLLAILFIGAVAIRGINLGSVPYLMDQDEAAFAHKGAILAYSFQLQATPFEQGAFSYARAFQLMIGVASLAFGKTLFAARLPGMLMGALIIPSVYLLGRELFNSSVGLVSALFMMGWAYQAHFSRLALNQTGDALFATLAFYFLLRGLRLQTLLNYVMAGVTLAMAQLFYLGARLAPLVMIVYLIYLAFQQRALIVKQWKSLAVMALAFFVLTLPQNYWIYYFQRPFTTRLGEEGIWDGVLQGTIQKGRPVYFMADQFKNAFSGLFTTGDTGGFAGATSGGWYGRGSNLMGVIGGPLLLIGVATTLLIFWRRPRWVLPLLWGMAVIVGGSVLSTNPPAYERYFPGVSAFSLLVALGVWAAAVAISHVLKRPQIIGRLMAGFGVLILTGNLAFYVFDYIPTQGYFNNRNNWLTNRVVDEMLPADKDGYYLVFVGGIQYEVQDTFVIQYYLAGERYTFIDTDLQVGLPNHVENFGVDYSKPIASAYTDPNFAVDFSKPLCFFVSAGRIQDLLKIEITFPGGTAYPVYLTQDQSLAFWVYRVNTNQTHF